MSRYTGWSREPPGQTGSSPDEISPEDISPLTSMSSFTPINQNPSSFKPAPRIIRQHSGGFDGSMLHDLPETSNDHAPQPKRRKTEPTILDASEYGTLQRGEGNTALGPNQIPNSLHLGVPPKLKSGKKKVTAKLKSTSKSQLELFADAPVTKPKQPRRKKPIGQPKTISYQGFTTTEDGLKNPVKLAQTTLDRLASFKYRSELANNQADVPEADSNVSNTFAHNSQASEFLGHEDEDCMPLTTMDAEESDLLNVAHFEDVYFANSRDWPLPDQHQDDFCDDQVDDVCTESTAKHAMNDSRVDDARFEMHTDNEALEDQGLIQDQRSILVLACDATESAVIGSDSSSGYFQVDVTDTTPPSEASYQSKVENSDQHNQSQFFDNSKMSNLTVDVETDPANSNMMSIGQSDEMTSKIVPASASDHQQDVDSADMEFNDGDINDEDLYAMRIVDASGQPCKSNAKHSRSTQSNAVHPVDTAPSRRLCASTSDQLISRNAITQSHSPTSVRQTLSKSIVNDGSPDSEDEFSIDEVEEEALMQFDILAGTVHEKYPPPSSIPFPSEGVESRDLEVYDGNLQYSDPCDTALEDQNDAQVLSGRMESTQPSSNTESPEGNWSFLPQKNLASHGKHHVSNHRSPLSPIQTAENRQVRCLPSAQQVDSQAPSRLEAYDNDSAEYLPLKPFARPEFPAPMLDRSPVIGFSGSVVLRTCFRIGEACRVAAVTDSGKQGILLELFARVTFSSREEETVKQHFQFADLFHDRPPFLTGFLENYKCCDLTNTESKQLLGASSTGQLVRCLGKARREYQGKRSLFIENIRMTDWEEIGRTKRIVEDLCGKVKPENGAGSNYL